MDKLPPEASSPNKLQFSSEALGGHFRIARKLMLFVAQGGFLAFCLLEWDARHPVIPNPEQYRYEIGRRRVGALVGRLGPAL